MLRVHSITGCVAAACLFVVIGCGSDSTTPSSSGPDPEPQDETGRQPPAAGPSAAGDGEGVVLAMDRLFLGETNRDGTANAASGWKQYGFNLDGKISTVESKDLCQPQPNAAPSSVYVDGDEGIDNSFGKNILTIIRGIEPNVSARVTDSIAAGDFTIMLSIDKLGASADYNPLGTKLYGGAALAAPPLWDGTDKWPVLPELLAVPTDITSAKVVFDGSYLVNNTWVSGSKGDINLNLGLAGYTINLTIRSAVIAMDLTEDHTGAINGTIAGVLETDVLVGELQKVVGAFDPSLCDGTTIEGILSQVRQASDIMKDGTQDPDQVCNGISIGLGFTMKKVQLGDIAPAAEPATNPCSTTAGG